MKIYTLYKAFLNAGKQLLRYFWFSWECVLYPENNQLFVKRPFMQYSLLDTLLPYAEIADFDKPPNSLAKENIQVVDLLPVSRVCNNLCCITP